MTINGLAGPSEQARLAETFVSLCEIESPSGCEAAAARFVRAELEALGLAVEEDASAPETGADWHGDPWLVRLNDAVDHAAVRVRLPPIE